MCGICGIVRFDGGPVAAGAVERACATLRHRGPDHTGQWIDPGQGVAFGATRLKVLDPSAAADQPLHHGTGRFHLVYNGEIYNFRELRDELIAASERFVTDGDTEVVLAACVRWGVEGFQRFNGMWALAFYDSQERKGFLSRDRFGVKPLFYVADEKALRFASELGALTTIDGWDRSVNPHAVASHLQFGYIAHPDTIYQTARRLPPGHYLSFGPNGAQSPIRYYEPHPNPQSLNVRPETPSPYPRTLPDAPALVASSDPRSARPTPQRGRGVLGCTPSATDYGEACVRLRRRLADAVVCRRVSDVPIGAFLSGGLDSSIIVSHLAEAIGRPVCTFSVGYAGQKSYDETAYARIAANRFGTDHHELVLTEGDVLDAIPGILDHLSEPVGDSSIIPTALLSQFARRFVTVALSGDGGDELFGGYWRYLGHESLASYLRIPSLLRRLMIEPMLSGLAASKSSALGNRVRQFRKLLRAGSGDSLERHVAWSRILSPEAESMLLDRGQVVACDHRAVETARQMTAALNGNDPLNVILAFDLQHQLPADMLQKVDLASMMHSLEVRVPFLDPSVVELAMAMPGSFKIDRGRRKRILIDAYRGHLPDVVLDRPKQGFEVPIGEFFRGPLRDMFFDTVTPKAIESFGLLSYPAIETIYRDHATRRADHADLLFALLSLCWWRRRALHG
jgi:asparagine synthase (glutamine-hydrolysing)